MSVFKFVLLGNLYLIRQLLPPLAGDTKVIQTLHVVTQGMVEVFWHVTDVANINIFVACFTTCQARLSRSRSLAFNDSKEIQDPEDGQKQVRLLLGKDGP